MVCIALCLVLIFTVAVLEYANVTHFFHKEPVVFKPTPTTGGGSANSQKGIPQSNNQQANANTSSSSATDSKSNDQISTTLLAPSGNFVSNHTPGQNGTPLLETSVCNTTPGAKCQIFFTDGNKTLSLTAQTTDLGGSTYWNGWTSQSIGLTPGSWQITATATANNQSKSTTDTRELVVSQ